MREGFVEASDGVPQKQDKLPLRAPPEPFGDVRHHRLGGIVDLRHQTPIGMERFAARQLEYSFRPLPGALPEQQVGETARSGHGGEEYEVRSTEYGVGTMLTESLSDVER